MQIGSIFELASRQAAWLSVRQKVVAENIAQANIPGYHAKDTATFSATLGSFPEKLVQTDLKHLPSSKSVSGINILVRENDGQKETVNVETELMKSIEVRTGLELNTAAVKAFHRMLLAAAKG